MKLLLGVSAIGLAAALYGTLASGFGWLGWLIASLFAALAVAAVLGGALGAGPPAEVPQPTTFELTAEQKALAALGAKQWSTAQLDDLRQVADPEADALIADAIAPREPGGKPDYAAAEELLVWLRDWTAPPTDKQPPRLREFFDAPVALPAWCGEPTLRHAEKLFETFGMLQVLCAALSGLPHFFTNGTGSRAFALARLFHPDVVKNRMIEVIQMVCYIGAKDGFFPAPVKGPGVLCVQKLRLIHAVVRVFLRPQWNIRTAGQPICQEDIAFATLSFAFGIIDGCKQLNLIDKREDETAIFTAWKLFGHLVGLQDALLPDTVEDGRQLLYLISQRMSAPSADGRVLTEELLAVASSFMPTLLDSVPAAMLRYLAGDAVADCLSVPRHDSRALGRLAGALGHKVSEHGALFRWLSNHISPLLLKQLAKQQRAGDRGQLILPASVQHAWQIDVNV